MHSPSLPTSFVFAGGGTGGHLFPALSVVNCLRAIEEPVDITFYCTQRPIDRDILGKADIEARPLSVRPFSTRPWHWPGFLYHWRRSLARCMRDFRERRPAVVIGAGGYASGPPVEAALRLGIPAFLLNPDAVPGRANRHFAARRGLTGIFAQWEVTRQYFPPDAPVWVMGCPVREGFSQCHPERSEGSPRRRDREDSRARTRAQVADILRSFDLETDRPTLLVTGASQGARTINEALILLAPDIAAHNWQVLHLSGASDQDRVRRTYAEAGVAAKVLAFTDRMPDAMVASDLIVSRAGASSLAEITATGIPAILLPYPYHRDEHQRHNAEQLEGAGAARMIRDEKDAHRNATALHPILTDLMKDESKRNEMRTASRSIGHPDAAQRIAARLAESAGLNPPQSDCLAG